MQHSLVSSISLLFFFFCLVVSVAMLNDLLNDIFLVNFGSIMKVSVCMIIVVLRLYMCVGTLWILFSWLVVIVRSS